MPILPQTTVAIVGGGLAGMAAAVAAVERGFQVELFEARPRLGGRAGSFHDPRTDSTIDYCQHVAMGCCTNLLDFCRRTGLRDAFAAHRELHFFGPDGRRCDFRASPWLPAPLHLLPGLMRLTYLSRSERWRIARTLGRLAREPVPADDRVPRPSRPCSGRAPELSDPFIEGHTADTAVAHEQTIGQWLRQQGQSERAIERFWSVVIASALSETVDRVPLSAARKVFVDGFLASRHAYELLLPRLPLSELWDDRVGAWLREHGADVHRGVRVARVDGDSQRATALVLADGTRRAFDFVVAAVPWQRVYSLCRTRSYCVPINPLLSMESAESARPMGSMGEMGTMRRSETASYEDLDRAFADPANLPAAPITAVHLWFDRPITRLPHAVIVGRTSQWLFNHGRLGRFAGRPGHYYQAVISASHALLGRSREAVLAEVRNDVESIWPGARGAELLHWRAITHRAAVFSMQPGVERLRSPQETAVPNLLLAGDWTATGWPATMEGAVRSGYLAAEAILKATGRNDRILVPDLPRAWLTRLLFGA